MLKSFWSNRSGNYATLLGIVAVPLLLAVGLAADYSRHVSAQKHLQELADVASLALAGSEETDTDKLHELAKNIIKSNRSGGRIENIKVGSLKVHKDWVDLRLRGDIPTTFMSLAKIHTLDVAASALAERAVTGSVEVALVLDNTHSMNYDDKIDTLKEAATNLVEELFDADADIRIGLVPYAEQINIGMANRDAPWISVAEDYSKTTPGGACYWVSTKGGGCKKKAPVTSCKVERDGIWVDASCGGGCIESNPPIEITPYQVCPKDKVTAYKWHGCIGARVSGSELVLDDQSPSVKYPGFLTSGGAKKRKCLTEVLPLTKSESDVTEAIEDMITSRDDYTPNTYIPAGAIWGVNMLSPDAPLTDGAGYDAANRKPRKVMVLMTDGLNTRKVVMSTGNYTGADADERIQTNTDTQTVCNYAKSRNIEIYTVAFKVDDENAKAMLLQCATSPDHYYDASDPDKLLAAFNGIGVSLRQIRLAR